MWLSFSSVGGFAKFLHVGKMVLFVLLGHCLYDRKELFAAVEVAV